MTDQQFEVVDELYFITNYDDLKTAVPYSDHQIRDILMQLWDKGWIKCYRTASEELFGQDIDIPTNWKQYYYLASKLGLLMHNSAD